jgi:hypothetical protein
MVTVTGDEVTVTWWDRTRHWIAGWLRPGTSTLTPAEYTLSLQVEHLGRVLRDRDGELARAQQEIRVLKTDLAQRDAEVAIRKTELELLAAVVTRDRQRVEAETAIANAQITQSQGQRPRP